MKKTSKVWGLSLTPKKHKNIKIDVKPNYGVAVATTESQAARPPLHAHTYRTIPSHHLEASLASELSVSLERARIVSVGLGGAILARRATHQGALVHTPAVGVLSCSLFRPKDRYTVSSLFLNAYLEVHIFVNDYSETWQGRKMDCSRE